MAVFTPSRREGPPWAIINFSPGEWTFGFAWAVYSLKHLEELTGEMDGEMRRERDGSRGEGGNGAAVVVVAAE